MPKNKKMYQLRLPSQSDNLSLIRDLVSKVAAQVGLSSEEAGKIELAVDEACTNVIKHAYGSNSNEVLDIQIKIEKTKLTIVVSDKGKGFNPDKIKIPDLSESIRTGKRGGLGICLIKTLMDKVDFQMNPGTKNQVKMVKYLS